MVAPISGCAVSADALPVDERVASLLAAVGPSAVAQPIREAASAELKRLATDEPDRVLPAWPRLVDMLESDNAFSRMSMVHVLALLAAADTRGRWATLVGPFFAHLGDAVSVAGHVLQAAPQIVAGRPELTERVVDEILRLPERAIPDRLGLLRGYAIDALDRLAPPDGWSPAVVSFVVDGVSADSAKTRKIAADTLRRRGLA